MSPRQPESLGELGSMLESFANEVRSDFARIEAGINTRIGREEYAEAIRRLDERIESLGRVSWAAATLVAILVVGAVVTVMFAMAGPGT